MSMKFKTDFTQGRLVSRQGEACAAASAPALLPVGTRVVLSEAGKNKLNDDIYNPHYGEGVVSEVIDAGPVYWVFWDNGKTNIYDPEHLTAIAPATTGAPHAPVETCNCPISWHGIVHAASCIHRPPLSERALARAALENVWGIVQPKPEPSYMTVRDYRFGERKDDRDDERRS